MRETGGLLSELLKSTEVQPDPAEVLLDALDRDDLDVRVAEGLPWQSQI
jgi:hypothetical protein